MADHVGRHRAPRAGWFGHGRTRALLSAGLLLGTGAVATSAYFTDQATIAGTTIRSGALHIDLKDNNQVRPENVTDWSLDLQTLTPGTSRSAVLKVRNNSVARAPLSYKVQGAATNALGGALQVVIRRDLGSGCASGDAVYSGALNSFSQDITAHLAPGAVHDLCFTVTLPATASVPANSSSTVTFTFPAKQEQS